MSKILVLDRGDTLAEQIRSLSDQFDEAPKITNCTRIGAVGEVLEEDGPFDVLVAGPSLGTRSGLARLRIISEELPEMRMVLAFSRRPDASLRDIVRTGAIDLLQLPVEDADMVEALERAAALARSAPEPVVVETLVAPEPEADHPRPNRPGIVYTISSATGGCGKTFYATNLAWFLHKWMGKSVCIVDLDLQFGEVSTALRLRPKYTIFDVLQREDADESDLLYVMATLDLPSVRNMSVFLSPLDRLRINTENLRLVLNKAEDDVGIDIDQVTKLFPQGFESILPYAKEVSRSINLGMPVMAASPDAEISRLMAGGMKFVLPPDLQAQVAQESAPKKAGLRRLFGK